MRAVIQRVLRARVVVGGQTVGAIGPGLCVLLGVAAGDSNGDAERLAAKIGRLRIFENEAGKFDRSLLAVGVYALFFCYFTLIPDTPNATRPRSPPAAPPEEAEPLYEAFCASLRALGVGVQTGVFGARMQVELLNDGPVTLVLS